MFWFPKLRPAECFGNKENTYSPNLMGSDWVRVFRGCLVLLKCSHATTGYGWWMHFNSTRQPLWGETYSWRRIRFLKPASAHTDARTLWWDNSTVLFLPAIWSIAATTGPLPKRILILNCVTKSQRILPKLPELVLQGLIEPSIAHSQRTFVVIQILVGKTLLNSLGFFCLLS